MSSTVDARELGARPAQPRSYVGSAAFNWTAAILSVLVTCGLFLDGWAHNHGKVDETFFTPWHAVLYGGVLVFTIFLMVSQWRGMRRGIPWRQALPAGYGLSLAGAFVFFAGGALDLLWHTLFGIEVNLETLLSPTHLLLASAGVLMVAGPLRASWADRQSAAASGWKALGPAILSLTMVFSIVTFMTQFAHPLVETYAARDPNAFARDSDIYMMAANGAGQTRLTTRLEQGGSGAAASPDGRKIVFTSSTPSASDPEAESELYLMDTDGQNWTQLTHNHRLNYLPAWSPDGTKIAFISGVGYEASDVYVIRADGTDETRLVATEGGDYGVSWSPDGKRIAFGSMDDGSWQIYSIPVDGSQTLQKLDSGGGYAPAWSPDGTKIAFASDRDGSSDILVMDADGGNVRQLTDSPSRDDTPTWSPDGSQIAYTSDRDGRGNIFVMNADGSGSRNVSQDPTRWNGTPNWLPDGKLLYTTTIDAPLQWGQFKALGIASILLQAALLVGFVLLATLGRLPPFGALTALIVLNAALMSTQHSHYELLPAALVAGIAADLLLAWLRPAEGRWRLPLFAFAVPAIFYSLYFLTLQLTGGIDWSTHLWLGSIVMAGMAGLLLGLLAAQLQFGPRQDGVQLE